MSLDSLPTRIRFNVKIVGECWIWQGAISETGYGAVNYEGRTQSAHRVFWAAENGPIPDNLELGHSCHNKPCVNPAHTSPMTHQDNMRMKTRPRLRLCKKGLHFMTPVNSYWMKGRARSNGKPLAVRLCKACKRKRERNWARKNRAKKGK